MFKAVVYAVVIALVGGLLVTGLGVMASSQASIPAAVASPTASQAVSTPEPVASAAAVYTMAQVAVHKTRTDCWTAVNSNVYDITTWMNTHPGGYITLTPLCGVDGTQSFNAYHSSSVTAKTKLGTYQIGSLDVPNMLPYGYYTTAQVATHNTSTNCWSIVSGSVYNLTAFRTLHQGGASAITDGCGKDRTSKFTGVHGSQANAKGVLAGYKVGVIGVAPTPTPTPTPTATASPTYTAAQVAAHAVQADCWTILDGNVYNLTGFMTPHPGGAAVLVPACGVDGGSIFHGRHGTPGTYYVGVLAAYKIGTLAVSSPSATPTTSANPTVTATPTPSVTVTPTASATPTVSASATPTASVSASPTQTAPASYTAADVAAHAVQADCWTILDGNVYNLTGFMTPHPGGAAVLVPACGVDGGSIFHGRHGTPGTYYVGVLAAYKIGSLAVSSPSASPSVTATPTASASPTPTVTASSSASATPTASASATSSTTASASASPTATTPASYTAADVAAHAVQADCWTILDGNVYNLTGFMTPHPGGASVLVPACGVDGGPIFHGRHGTPGTYYVGVLAAYKIGSLAVSSPSASPSPSSTPTPSVTATPTASATPTPSATVTPTASSTPTASTTPTASASPTATMPASYTAAQVSAHAVQADCWTILDGNVYNLTAFMTHHPGGAAVLVPACGVDGGSIFHGRHGTPGTYYVGVLSAYKIGTLAVSSPSASPSTSSTPSVTPTASASATPSVSVTPTATVSATPSASVSATPTATAPASYTAAQVAAHAVQADCWIILDGSVYNLTSFMTPHPGGASVLVPACGVDGGPIFHGRHGTPGTYYVGVLAAYKIGTLAVSSPSASPTTSATPTVSATPSASATVTPTASATPTATAPASASPTAPTSYTAAQVAAHAVQADCWTILDGNVYNLTGFMTPHPGGASVLVPACGVDGGPIFHGRHGTPGTYYVGVLAAYKIGTVSGATPTPTATPSAPGSYTLAQVKLHATPADCWTAVNGSVYDITKWIGIHPGGRASIEAMCGTEGTLAFYGKHTSSAGAKSTLENYKIGTQSDFTPVALPAPADVEQVTSTGGEYTMDDVAKHNTASDCWSAIGGGVYGLSTWIPKHPGGSGVVEAMCGQDGTAAYAGKHGGSGSAGAILAKLRMGSLVASKPKPMGNYTLKDVAAHASATDCWSAVNGSVYDLTKWIGQHPGGRGSIEAMCGTDGTAMFNGKHGSSAGAATALASFKIGTLLADEPTTQTDPAYTLADVAKHNIASDCWSIVNGSVYNLTAWVPKHPGGKSSITAMCGTDGSAPFNGMHSKSDSAKGALAGYRIGTVATTPTAGPTEKVIPLSQVRKHSTPASCWTVVNGNVYNLTGFIKAKNLGEEFTESVCGKDGTKRLTARYGSVKVATKVIKKYRVGKAATTHPTRKSYTPAQVAKHDTPSSCWSIVGKSVYNLTGWVGEHPGGRSAIIGMCGVNATAQFNAQHANSSTAKRALSPFRIGPVRGR